MAKKMIRPLRSEADYDAPLKEIERYFENEPEAGRSPVPPPRHLDEPRRRRTMPAPQNNGHARKPGGGPPARHDAWSAVLAAVASLCQLQQLNP